MGFAELQLAPNLFDLSRSATLGVGWMNLGVSVAKRAAQLRSQVLGLHFRLPMLQLQKIDMQKHHESKAHKAAVKFWLKEGGCVGLWQDMAYSPLGVVAISCPALCNKAKLVLVFTDSSVDQGMKKGCLILNNDNLETIQLGLMQLGNYTLKISYSIQLELHVTVLKLTSSPLLLRPFPWPRTHFLVRLLLLRPSNTREVLMQQPAKHYLVEPYKNIIQCARNSISWIYTNMNPYMKPRHKDKVQGSLDLLTTIRILPWDQQPDERQMSIWSLLFHCLPQNPERMQVNEVTEKEFAVTALFLEELATTCPGPPPPSSGNNGLVLKTFAASSRSGHC